jgi:hypothetical protein
MQRRRLSFKSVDMQVNGIADENGRLQLHFGF